MVNPAVSSFPAEDKCIALDASDLASFLLRYLLTQNNGHSIQAMVSKENDFEGFKRSTLFASELIHPVIQERAWTDFMKGDYDAAVFKAFQLIEHRVRELVKQQTGNAVADDLVGINLMRKVFHPENGLLTLQKDPAAERESLMHLFGGAIGLGKNPHSHRRVGLRDPVEAVRLIVFASYLLTLAELRPTQLDFGDVDLSDYEDELRGE